MLKADPTRRSCRCGRWPSRKASSSTWLSRLREPKPFIELDPARVTASARRAASIRGSAGAGRPIGLESMRRLDLVVCASVAVNRRGARIGKGGGYADVELGLATDAGLVGGDTVIVTTVHPLQILDAELPETRHDFRVDLLVTHDEVIRCRKARRPPGIIWDHLTSEKIEAIPALAARRTS